MDQKSVIFFTSAESIGRNTRRRLRRCSELVVHENTSVESAKNPERQDHAERGYAQVELRLDKAIAWADKLPLELGTVHICPAQVEEKIKDLHNQGRLRGALLEQGIELNGIRFDPFTIMQGTFVEKKPRSRDEERKIIPELLARAGVHRGDGIEPPRAADSESV